MDEAMKFRKKPVVIEATLPSKDPMPDWLLEAINDGTVEPRGLGLWSIKTLEGELLVSPGDWIIRGIKGELYPCKPDIFSATYDHDET